MPSRTPNAIPIYNIPFQLQNEMNQYQNGITLIKF